MSDARLAVFGTFAGRGTEGLFSFRVGRGGPLERCDAIDGGGGPSYLALHPDGEVVYAANNTEEGGVTAVAIDPDSGALTEQDTADIGESGPCYCTVDSVGEYLVTANGSGGSVALLPVDGHEVAPPVDVVAHAADPEDAHPHSVVFGPEERFVYVPDRNADEIVVYELDRDAGRLRPADCGPVGLPAGSGPRHLVVHPDGRWAYLVNERESTLVALERERAGALVVRETVGTLPAEFDGENHPADVHVHPTGDVVYCSNRGHDSIARFELEAGRPRFVGTTPTRGEWPRTFAVGPDGDRLVVQNQNAGTAVPFALGPGGAPEHVGGAVEVPEPTCCRFLG